MKLQKPKFKIGDYVTLGDSHEGWITGFTYRAKKIQIKYRGDNIIGIEENTPPAYFITGWNGKGFEKFMKKKDPPIANKPV